MLSESVRIKFAKTGKLSYISHLDLCRTLRTAFIRAGIPIWYSQGFNPHPKMVFALTVSVGSESVCEYLDIRITSPMSEEEFKKRLQGALTPELAILEVYTPERKFLDMRASVYEIELEGELDNDWLQEMIGQPLVVIKHGKKGDKEEDIAPQIYSASVEGHLLKATLAAEQGKFLNPENFVKAILQKKAVDWAYAILRRDCLLEDGSSFR